MNAPVAGETLAFEGWQFDPRSGGLLRQDPNGFWRPVSIGARARDILAFLLEQPGVLASKDAIMDAVWPNVAVEPNNLTVQIAALRRVLDGGRAGGSCIQTVPGRGYRFVPTVTQSQLARSGVSSASHAPRLSVAVLPFKNLGGDSSDDWLADGITDDLTAELSRKPGMFLIARGSDYTYKDKAVDARTIGDDLGVRYVVVGSVRNLGDLLRVYVQLVSTETGAQLWAHHFDQQLEDLKAGRKEVVRRIGQILNVAVTDIESARSKQERPANPDAFDLIIRIRSLGLHPMGPRKHAERLALSEQALRLDPASVLAMTELAGELVRLTCILNFGDELGRAAKLLADAAAISPSHSNVLDVTAYMLYHDGRYAEGIAAYQRLLDYYPNCHVAYNQIGFCLVFTGHAEEAVPIIEMAIRREPLSAFNYSRYENLGFALLMLGRDEEAITWLQRALATIPDDFVTRRADYHVRLAAAHARLRRFDEARRAIAEANRIWPYDTVRTHWPRDPTSLVHAQQIECYQAALRLAGHRDHAEEDADFGVAPDGELHRDLAGLTPAAVPGAMTIGTAQLVRLLVERKPIVIDPLMYSWGRSIPGAVGLKRAGWGSSYRDAAQERLHRKMQELTKGDRATPIVAAGFNSERFDGRNLALRLVALGYTQVYWYRGGREAWEVNSLPETTLDVQEW